MTAERGGEPVDWLDLMRRMHTNKTTGEVQDPVARDLLETLSKLKEDKEAQLQSQMCTAEGSTSSNILSREEIKQMVLENVPVKNGRRYGLGRLSEGISATQPSCSPPHLIQEMEQLKTDLVEERTMRQQLKTDLLKEQTYRQALEHQLQNITDFMSRVYTDQFSASKPDSQPNQ
ncbi:unnamed protein product [Eruca vesicaria subsp. sativa]|uniref:Uncharacterized protein n=1 Tax=Eruca vesicaria subsp. sativa TaxID=29727 RepID=A0ABC8KPN2_ERUVS|nr:unnamed protein product [Eruca vesicaria subsp. sativa]